MRGNAQGCFSYACLLPGKLSCAKQSSTTFKTHAKCAAVGFAQDKYSSLGVHSATARPSAIRSKLWAACLQASAFPNLPISTSSLPV